MRRLTKFILIISLTLLFISACTESNRQTRQVEKDLDAKHLAAIQDLIDADKSKFSIGQRSSSHGSTIEVIKNKAKSRIEYISYKKLVNDIKKKAKLRMWSQNKINYKIQSLPRGGNILIHVFSNTIDSANTKWWEYIVLSLNGKVIMRKRGSDTLPNYTKSRIYNNVWSDTDVLPLTNDVGQQFKVFVIDILRGKRSGFIVYPNLVKN